MAFIFCPQGNLKDVFVTEADIVDRFVGNQLWLWGYASFGRLGISSGGGCCSPTQTVSTGTNWKQVSLGCLHSAAIKTDGTLWLWGSGGNGQLGTNSTSNITSPVQTVTTGTNWKQVSLGCVFAAAIKTDGTLWMWGCGGNGQLGTNSTTNRSSPVQTVTTGSNWKQVGLGKDHSAAIKTDGTLWLWGNGASGRLGNNSTICQSSPVQTVTTGTNWKQVALGACHSASIKTDGTLWMWGDDAFGQLGNNSTTNQLSPVQTVTTGTNWKQVSLGECHSAAIKTDGTLWLWGGGASGRLGNNSVINRSSPVQTATTGSNWKQVGLGFDHSAAVKTDGTLWLWGGNDYGKVGNGCVASISFPGLIVSRGTNWKQVALGTCHSAAVTFTES